MPNPNEIPGERVTVIMHELVDAVIIAGEGEARYLVLTEDTRLILDDKGVPLPPLPPINWKDPSIGVA